MSLEATVARSRVVRGRLLLAALVAVTISGSAAAPSAARAQAASSSGRGAAESGAADGASKHEVSIEFAGQKSIAVADLRRVLNPLVDELRRNGVDEAAVEDVEYVVESYCVSQGFLTATVRAARREGTAPAHIIDVRITEGPRTYLGAPVRFLGNRFFIDERLSPCFQWIRPGVVGGFLGVGRQVYSREAATNGAACVEALYRYAGFPHVVVTWALEGEGTTDARGADSGATEAPTAAGREGGAAQSERTVRVVVRIEEGPRTFVRGVHITGAESISDDDVRDALRLDPDVPFDPRLPLVLRGRLVDLYQRRGYRLVRVSVDREIRVVGEGDEAVGEAYLTLVVEEGPLTTIGGWSLRGDPRTRDWVFDQYVHFRAGDLYNEERIRDTYRSLIRSGLFDSVNLHRVADPDDASRVTIEIDVSEKPRWQIGTLVGYGSWEQIRGGVTIENRNVFGTGHRVRAEGTASFRGERATLGYVNPHVFTESLSHDVSGFYSRREQRSFTTQDYGGETGLGLRISRQLRTRFSYRVDESNLLEAGEDVPPELLQDVFIGSLRWSVTYDSRDQFLDPRKGFKIQPALEYAADALGSDIDFLRATIATSWAQRIVGDLRLVVGARTGVIQRLADTQAIPLQQRFYLGGDDTIRSYRQDLAGPVIEGAALGGEAFVLGGAELRVPFSFLPGFLGNFEGVLFGDIGTVNLDIEDYGGGRWYFAVGPGLRYATPFGPFRVDCGFNPDQAAGEELFTVHFGLGYPF